MGARTLGKVREATAGAVLLCAQAASGAGFLSTDPEPEASVAVAAALIQVERERVSERGRPALPDPDWEAYRDAYNRCVRDGTPMYVWLDCRDVDTFLATSGRVRHVWLDRRFFARFGVESPCVIVYKRDGDEPREYGRKWFRGGRWE